MSKAWGHTVRLLTDAEIMHQKEMGKSWFRYMLEHPKEGHTPDEEKYIRTERKCRISSKCQNESWYMLMYRYVTGRAGRVSVAQKPVCEHHAKKYFDNQQTQDK